MLASYHFSIKKYQLQFYIILLSANFPHRRTYTTSAPKNIQKITSKDIQLIEHLKKLEANAGWNPGKYDVEYLLQSGQVDLAVHFDNNRPVGYMSLFKSGNFSFFGSLIVEPEQRKKGFGKDLWKYMSAQATQKIGLYGVTSMTPYYAQNGFEYTNIIRRITFTLPDQYRSNTPYTLQKYSYDTINSICTFDYNLTKINRAGIIQAITRDDQHTFFDISTINEKISGYGLLRMLHQGLRLSLYACSEVHATIILKKLIANYSHTTKNDSTTVIVDVPEERLLPTVNVIKELGMHPKVSPEDEFKLCTMFFNPHKEMETNLDNGCFGLLFLEIG